MEAGHTDFGKQQLIKTFSFSKYLRVTLQRALKKICITIIIIGNKLKPCKSEKFQAFDGSSKVHCFNMDPQVVMIGKVK